MLVSNYSSALSVFSEINSLPHNIEAPHLNKPSATFDSNKNIGKVWIIIMWASWVNKSEEWKEYWKYLLEVSKNNKQIMYGLNNIDKSKLAIKKLNDFGNPFIHSFVGDNRMGMELNVYELPQLLVISKYGQVIYRHTRILKSGDWEI